MANAAEPRQDAARANPPQRATMTRRELALLSTAGIWTVSDDEIKFGYSVTGTVHPDRVWTNGGAKVGDTLILTKLLGTGGALIRALPGEELALCRRGRAAQQERNGERRRCFRGWQR